LSGDIVFLANNGSPIGFATVRDCPKPPSSQGCDTVDTLAEIDVAALSSGSGGSVLKSIRGQIVRGASCSDSSSGYGSVFGVAAYADKVLGFSRSGNGGYAIAIDNV